MTEIIGNTWTIYATSSCVSIADLWGKEVGREVSPGWDCLLATVTRALSVVRLYSQCEHGNHKWETAGRHYKPWNKLTFIVHSQMPLSSPHNTMTTVSIVTMKTPEPPTWFSQLVIQRSHLMVQCGIGVIDSFLKVYKSTPKCPKKTNTVISRAWWLENI